MEIRPPRSEYKDFDISRYMSAIVEQYFRSMEKELDDEALHEELQVLVRTANEDLQRLGVIGAGALCDAGTMLSVYQQGVLSKERAVEAVTGVYHGIAVVEERLPVDESGEDDYVSRPHLIHRVLWNHVNFASPDASVEIKLYATPPVELDTIHLFPMNNSADMRKRKWNLHKGLDLDLEQPLNVSELHRNFESMSDAAASLEVWQINADRFIDDLSRQLPVIGKQIVILSEELLVHSGEYETESPEDEIVDYFTDNTEPVIGKCVGVGLMVNRRAGADERSFETLTRPQIALVIELPTELGSTVIAKAPFHAVREVQVL
jgi:hypothetical protein